MLEGEKSSTTNVTSGVPQCSVLGPLLFLVFINDLPKCVSFSIRLYADDALLYRTIKSRNDIDALHRDLTSIQEWEKTWLMSFNADKCEIIQGTGHARASRANKTVNNFPLKWGNHLQQILA